MVESVVPQEQMELFNRSKKMPERMSEDMAMQEPQEQLTESGLRRDDPKVALSEFGSFLISDRYDFSQDKIMSGVLDSNLKYYLKYFYWSSIPLEQTSFNFIEKALDMRHMDFRIQTYIRSRAKINIGSQAGAMQ